MFANLFRHSSTRKPQAAGTKPRRKARIQLRCELLEDRLAPATHRWNGFGANANWTTNQNWDIGAPNTADDILVFPAGALQPANANNFAAGTSFQQIRFEGGGYTLSGNAFTLGTGGVQSNTGFNLIQFNMTTASGQPALTVLAGSLGISGVIGGAGGLGKNGLGQLILSGTNTFAGDFDLGDGTVTLQNAAGLGAAGGNTTVIQSSSPVATLELAAGVGTVAETIVPVGLALADAGRIRNLGGTNTLSGTVGFFSFGNVQVDAGSQLNITGPITLGGFFKTGAGRLVLSGNNSFGGDVTVVGGTLAVESANALGTTVGNTIVGSGETLEIGNNITSPEPLSLTGTGVGGGGALRSVAGSNAVSGPITLAGDTTIFVNTGSTLTLSGDISGAAGFDITKTGQGRLVLSGDNTYLGLTNVSQGVLSMSSNTALGATSAGTIVLTGATLEVDPNSSGNIAESLALNGAGTAGSGALRGTGILTRLTGNVALNGATTIRVDTSDVELLGVVSGAAAATLTKTGIGQLELRGGNTFAGQVLVNQGTLRIAENTSLGATTAGTVVANGAALFVESSDVGAEPLSLAGIGPTGDGALEASGNSSYAGTVTLSSTVVRMSNTTEITLTGPIVNGVAGAGIEKTGVGRVLLAGNNTYNGTTRLVAGTLEVNGSQGNSAVVVDGGILRGTGTIGALTANAGIVAPGQGVTGVGRLFVNGNITFNAGSTYQARMNGTTPGTQFDQLRAIGGVARTVAINGAALDAEVSFAAAGGAAFMIIENATLGTSTGVGFTGIAQSALFTAEGVGTAADQPFRMNYVGGDSDDLVITRNTAPMVEYILMYPETIQAGEYSYLVGQLTDPDPDDFQYLIIFWGDDSEYEIQYPGLEPFVYYHQYTTPGDYYVVPIWVDLAGEYNFRVLPLTVLPGRASDETGQQAGAADVVHGLQAAATTPVHEVARPSLVTDVVFGGETSPADYHFAAGDAVQVLAQRDAGRPAADDVFATDFAFLNEAFA